MHTHMQIHIASARVLVVTVNLENQKMITELCLQGLSEEIGI